MAEPVRKWTFIRQRRVQLGKSAVQLASELGISLTYMAQIEGGHRRLSHNVELLGRLADALEVDVLELDRSRPPRARDHAGTSTPIQPAEVA